MPNFPENCMKSKEFGRPGGGVRPSRPPLDPPMICLVLVPPIGFSIKGCTRTKDVRGEDVNRLLIFSKNRTKSKKNLAERGAYPKFGPFSCSSPIHG